MDVGGENIFHLPEFLRFVLLFDFGVGFVGIYYFLVFLACCVGVEHVSRMRERNLQRVVDLLKVLESAPIGGHIFVGGRLRIERLHKKK